MMKCFVVNVAINSYYNFWVKDFFANAHAFLWNHSQPIEHLAIKVTNTIFCMTHKKVLSAYTKISMYCWKRRGTNVEPSSKSLEKVIIPVVADTRTGGCAFQ